MLYNIEYVNGHLCVINVTLSGKKKEEKKNYGATKVCSWALGSVTIS
jgi:hypothetical protein